MTRTPVQDVTLPGGAGTLALVTLDNGHDHTRPNTFGPQTIAGLQATVDGLRARAEAGEIQAVGITGKPFVFAVGADLSGVPYVTEREQALAIARAGHAAFASIMDLPGADLRLRQRRGHGRRRRARPRVRLPHHLVPACRAFALPETFLGLVPGWGGCYLLPNLVGAADALKVIIENPLSQNRMLKAKEVAALGIADVLLEPADFLEDSLRWAAGVARRRRHRAAPRGRPRRGRLGRRVRRRHASSCSPRPAAAPPARCAPSSWSRAARTATRDEAFAAEDEALGDLIMTDELRAGLYAFDLVQKRAKRPAGAPDKSLARPVTKVGIVGAGLMASQLALLFARRLGVPVVLTDLDEERVAKGVGWVHAEIAGLLAKRRLSPDKASFLTGLVTGSTSKDGFADADFVIEAVFEEMAVKQQVFAEVEAVVSPECVLATNTSSLSITEMASGLRAPRAGRRLPLLQPGRRHAAARDHPRRGHRRRGAGHGVRHRPHPGQDDDPGQGLGILRRQPPARPLHGRVLADRRRGHPGAPPPTGPSPASPRCRRSCCSAWSARRSRCTTARRCTAPSATASTSRRACAASSRRASAATTAMEDGRPVPDPEVLALAEQPEHPVELTVEQARERILGVLAEEVGLMLAEGVVAAPMDIDLAMITGAGFQFWNGGLVPAARPRGRLRAGARAGACCPPGSPASRPEPAA